MNALTRSVYRLARPALTKPIQATRTFTTFQPLRPTLQPSTFRPQPTTFTPTSTTTAATADVVPATAITTNPFALGSIRCGPRNTMNGHTRKIQKRRHGFLKRMRSKDGRKILLRRRIKGRSQVAQ